MQLSKLECVRASMATELTSTPAGKAQKAEIPHERAALLSASPLPHINLAVRSVCAAGHFQQPWVTISGQIQLPGPSSGILIYD